MADKGPGTYGIEPLGTGRPTNFVPLQTVQNMPAYQLQSSNVMPNPTASPPQERDVTWLRIISRQIDQIIRTMSGGRGRAGPPSPGSSRATNHPLTRLGNFWANVSNIFGGFGQIGRGLARGRLGQAAFGAARAGQALEYLEGMFGGAGRGAAAAGGGAARGAAGAAARGGASAAGAAVGGAAMAVGAAVAVVEFVREVKQAADEMVQFNRKLGEVSASMGLIFAQREVREILRERDRGDRLAPSAARLVENEQRYKDAALPFETAWAELKNDFLGAFYKNLGDLVLITTKILEKMGVDLDNKEGDRIDQSFSGLINRAADIAKNDRKLARDRARGHR